MVKTEQNKGINEKFDVFLRVFNRFVWLIPPVIVAVAMLIWLSVRDLYPFSQKSITWADMSQQYIPLLSSFKDILAGKDGFFFSIRNGAGMNFYGVFFYYLASPFTFLVTFVDKADMWGFVNILVMLKMCAISATASFYLSRKYPNAPILNIFLSVLYAYSGYVLMYYQIAAWLDVMYLFPLLLLGLEGLKEGKRALFIFALSASIIVNFYLGYMLVIFLLLYVFVYLIMSKDKKFAGNFVLCCIISMLISAIAWLPSLLQYFSSGRKTSLVESLSNAKPFVSYQTTWQTVLSMLFLFPFAFYRRKEGDQDGKLRQILFFAMLVPMVLEPINMMWQTGNYMCFPTRYGFMPLFLCITLAMDTLAAPKAFKENSTEKTPTGENVSSLSKGAKILAFLKKDGGRYAISAVLVFVSVLYCWFAISYTKENVEVMDQYSSSLWGNDASFNALIRLYSLAALVGVALFIFYRFGLVKRGMLWLSVGVLVLSELYVAPMTYMSYPGSDRGNQTVEYNNVVELSNVIEDDSFYRVKMEEKDFKPSMVSAIGYNALGHFTSLTNGDYMYAMKQFGYSSYWMEVGGYGGTAITDALLSAKYMISDKEYAADIYRGEKYNISKTPVALDLGIIARRDIIQAADETDYSYRAKTQEILYEDFFGENDCITYYNLDSDCVSRGSVKVTQRENGTDLTAGTITFNIDVKGTQTLYFNVFAKNDNALNQPINKDFDVKSPISWSQFPQQGSNGLLRLGEFKDRQVQVKINVRTATTVQDFGVLAVENSKVAEAAKNVKTIGLRAGKNKIYGSYTAEGGECVFLSVPYDSGFRLKINGKKADYYKVYDGFIGFYLQEGENRIELTYLSPGFPVAVFLTVCGTGLCAAAFVLWKHKKIRVEMPAIIDKVVYYGLIVAGVAVIAVIYVMPLLLAV